MIDFLMLLACALTRLFRSKARLEAEILVLRHQLNILPKERPSRASIACRLLACIVLFLACSMR